MGGCWGIRGATTAEDNSRDSILSATKELLQRITDENDLDKSQVAAVWFTTTSDLNRWCFNVNVAAESPVRIDR